MRVSSLQSSAAMLHGINRYSTTFNKLTEKMITQKSILVPSDNPIASTRLVQLNREQSAINQYQDNITRLSGRLSQQEAHFDSISKQLLSMRDKVLESKNDTTNSSGLSGYGNELDSMLNSIVGVLNSKDGEGRYLFSGTATGTKPIEFDEASGQYVYKGNSNTRDVSVANGIHIQENNNAGEVFFDNGHDLLNEINKLAEMMKDPNTDMKSPAYQDTINNILEHIDGAIDGVTNVIGDMGSRQNQLTLLNDAHVDIKTSNELVIKDLSHLDYAEASIDLNGQMLAIQAAQSTFVKISQLSLFDAIR